MRLVLCEGKHGTSALQGLLEFAFGCTTLLDEPRPEWYAPPPRSGQTLYQLRSPSGVDIFIHGLGGKEKFWKAVRLRLGSKSLPDAKSIALCFDPDKQSQDDWRKSIENLLPQNGYNWKRTGWGYRVNGAITPVDVLPVPWLSPQEDFKEHFPQVESLYRTTVDCLAAVFLERAKRVDEWTAQVAQNASARSWKMLCWFWMAGWFAKAACDHFFREVMRDPEIHTVLQQSEKTAPVWQSLAEVGR